MYRVAINTALMNYRDKSVDLNQAEHITSTKNRYDHYFSDHKNEKVISLYMAIDQLSPVNKAIIIFYLDDTNYQEISNILGLTVSNFGVRINRIKNKLKKLMEYESIR